MLNEDGGNTVIWQYECGHLVDKADPLLERTNDNQERQMIEKLK